MTVRVFGTTAIVTGSNTEKSKENGRDTSGKYVWTDAFVNQNGLWKAVASQSAKIVLMCGPRARYFSIGPSSC